MLKVEHVRHVQDHVLFLRFNNGIEGEVDLAAELSGEVFVPLRDVRLFRQVRLDPETRTVVWPNGADLTPEFLLSLLGTGKV